VSHAERLQPDFINHSVGSPEKFGHSSLIPTVNRRLLRANYAELLHPAVAFSARKNQVLKRIFELKQRR
jgi:hypothetical protein